MKTARLTLTAEQRAAVEAPDGAYLLAAPPGSGKTEVLVRRVIWLLEQTPEEPFGVLGLTYTTKAADELRGRVQEALGDKGWRVTASTFHAFCLDMLVHYGEPVGVEPDVTVYDDELRVFAFADALRDAGLVPDGAEGGPAGPAALRRCLGAIDRLRCDLVPAELAPEEPCLPDVPLREAYAAYDHALEAAGALDFSAMLFKAHQLLVLDPWVSRHYRRLYRHVLVDEAHDLNRIQYEILKVLFSDGPRDVFLVADDDQEILTFAGASFDHARRFAEQLDATSLSLSTNFRCAGAIIDAAERLKAHFGPGRPPKPPMVPSTPAPGWVGAWSLDDEPAEAVAVVDWINRLLEEGLPADWLHEGEDPALIPERVGVIGRTRYSFDALAHVLEQREVPYVLRTEEGGLFDSEVGRATYFAMRVLANPRDRVSRRRLAAHVGELAADSDAAVARESAPGFEAGGEADVTSFLHDLAGDPSFPEVLVEALTRPGSVEELVDRLSAVEVAEPDDRQRADTSQAELWSQDRQRLSGWWKDYAAVTDHGDRSLPGFLRHLARLQRTSPSDPGIRLLTPHRAQGMQFRAVVVLGMNEGTFPFYRAVEEGKLDEERRALYVSVTRAERALLLTRPRSRVTAWGNVRSDPASRFVAELGVTVAGE